MKMAKLHSYFVLCPLIDQNSFLGVSPDKNPEDVIVTLGRNVVNKYRLSDQKQVCGWTSRDHITSAVVYDINKDAYVGIFNKNTIKIWENDSESLDKLKKYKFPVNILQILSRSKLPPLLIFENGNCASLPYALENRKTYDSKSIIKENENIVDACSYTLNNSDYVCYIVKDSKNRYEIISSPVREELGDLEKSKIVKMKVSRQESKDLCVVGVLATCTQIPIVYVLWSDTKMTAYDLSDKTLKSIGSVPWVSTLSSVSMACMGKHHVVLFGSNMEQDGAIIVAYNVVLGVGSCKYPMKMYSEGARLYCYNDRLILEASNHIGMLPYVLETKRNLSSLLGSQDIVPDDYMDIANWDSSTEIVLPNNKNVKELLKLGLSERNMCAQVVVPMLEKSDYKNVLRAVSDFKDVPESVLVLLLQYSFKLIGTKNIEFSTFEDFVNWYATCNANTREMLTLLNYLLEIPFSDALLIVHLRESLSLDDALFLLSYICILLIDVNFEMDAEYERKVFDWSILLIDAFYQQFVMTKDVKITNVLNITMQIVQKLMKQLKYIDNLLPMFHKLMLGQANQNDNDELLPYSIELMNI